MYHYWVFYYSTRTYLVWDTLYCYMLCAHGFCCTKTPVGSRSYKNRAFSIFGLEVIEVTTLSFTFLCLFNATISFCYWMPSVLWRCWLGSRKGIWPVKNWVVGCWHGYLSGRGADLHMAGWCHCHSLSLASVNPDWFYLPGFTILVPAHLGSLGHSLGGCKMVLLVVDVVSFCYWWMFTFVLLDLDFSVLAKTCFVSSEAWNLDSRRWSVAQLEFSVGSWDVTCSWQQQRAHVDARHWTVSDRLATVAVAYSGYPSHRQVPTVVGRNWWVSESTVGCMSTTFKTSVDNLMTLTNQS